MTGNHEAIIEPEIFDMVQRELARRGKGKNRHSGVYDFSGKLSAASAALGSARKYDRDRKSVV